MNSNTMYILLDWQWFQYSSFVNSEWRYAVFICEKDLHDGQSIAVLTEKGKETINRFSDIDMQRERLRL
jgi:hypothetical protein